MKGLNICRALGFSVLSGAIFITPRAAKVIFSFPVAIVDIPAKLCDETRLPQLGTVAIIQYGADLFGQSINSVDAIPLLCEMAGRKLDHNSVPRMLRWLIKRTGL
jgi:hypothetical protein